MFSVAPDQEPTNCVAIATSATSIIVTWVAPDPPNGIIEDYRLVYGPTAAVAEYDPMEFEDETNMTTGSDRTNVSTTGLQEAVRYNFRIAAINQIGEGPLTSTDCSVITDESSKC